MRLEWVPRRVRDRYREQPPFDAGERDERRVRDFLRPHGRIDLNVNRGRDVEASGPLTATKGPSMQTTDYKQQTIPLGARVQKIWAPLWIGTVLGYNPEREDFPLRVCFDDGSVESCCALELDVLSVPEREVEAVPQAEQDRRVGRIMRLADELRARQ